MKPLRWMLEIASNKTDTSEDHNINVMDIKKVVAALTIGYVGIWLRQTTHTTAGVVSADRLTYLT
jgi:hypothetical protein